MVVQWLTIYEMKFTFLWSVISNFVTAVSFLQIFLCPIINAASLFNNVCEFHCLNFNRQFNSVVFVISSFLIHVIWFLYNNEMHIWHIYFYLGPFFYFENFLLVFCYKNFIFISHSMARFCSRKDSTVLTFTHLRIYCYSLKAEL